MVRGARKAMSLDLSGVVAFATKALGEIVPLVSAGASVVSLVSNTKNALQTMQAQNRGPTQQEWDALDAEINSLRQQLHAP